MRIVSQILLLLLIGLAGCAQPQAKPEGPLQVAVSIPSLQWLIPEQLLTVHVAIPAHADPHTWTPLAQDVVGLAECQLFFRLNTAIEDQLLAKLLPNAPKMKVVNLVTSSGIEWEGPPPTDPHVLLDPEVVHAMLATVTKELALLDPAHAAEYREHEEARHVELQEASKMVEQTLAPHTGKTFYAYHPAYTHFARRFGLIERAVEVDGKAPDARELAALVELAKEDHPTMLLQSPEIPASIVKPFADSLGTEVVTIDPLANDLPHIWEQLRTTLAQDFEARMVKQITP